MSAVRIALLNASGETDHTPRNFRRELDADLVEFAVQDCQLPTDFAFDGCVVTGSRASVYWDEPWIDPLKEWVGSAIDRGLPFLGVCYGHQLLADVLGGTVEDMGKYEIGYREITHTGEDPLFAGIDREFVAFTTHSDRVAELPRGATRIAQNDFGVHGFRKDRVVGVQFHPEYDMATAESVTRGKDELGPETRESVIADITPDRYATACQSKQVFTNFIGDLAATAETPPAAD